MKRSHALLISTFLSFFSLNLIIAQPDDSSNLPSEAEEASLVYFFEAETLAYDVYIEFYNAWGTLIFGNIAESESEHADKVWEKIVKFGLEERFATTPPVLTDLYDEVVQAKNVMEALRAAGLIEELSIQAFEDIHPEISVQCLQVLYDHLYRGSRNHLRAFVKHYELLGGVYEVQAIDQDLFDAIVGIPTERGTFRTGPSRRGSGPWLRRNSTTDPTGQPWAQFWHGPQNRSEQPDGEVTGSGSCHLCPDGSDKGKNGNNGSKGGNSGGTGGGT